MCTVTWRVLIVMVHDGGWTRIAHVNMSEPGASCPDGLYEKEFVDSSRTLCTVGSWTESLTNVCNSTVFSVHNITHNKVCGYVRGYQHRRGVGLYHNSLSLNKPLGENPLITARGVHSSNKWYSIRGYLDIYECMG